MDTTIILIGPIGAGKSAVGRRLAAKLGLPLCTVDDVRWAYYAEMGYDKALAAKIASSEQGFRGMLRYGEPFDAQLLAMVLADHYGVIDFGASNSIYEDNEILARVEGVLLPYPNVVLLLPSADAAESALILQNRLIKMLNEAGKTFTDELFELNEYFIQHSSNQRLAKLTIYTKDKTPDDICAELVQKLA